MDRSSLRNRGGRLTPRGSPTDCGGKHSLAAADRQRQLLSKPACLGTRYPPKLFTLSLESDVNYWGRRPFAAPAFASRVSSATALYTAPRRNGSASGQSQAWLAFDNLSVANFSDQPLVPFCIHYFPSATVRLAVLIGLLNCLDDFGLP